MANKTSKHQAKVKAAEKVPHTFERLTASIKALPKELKL